MDGAKGETNEAEVTADEPLDVTVEEDEAMVVTIVVGEVDDFSMIEEREVGEMMVGVGEQMVVMTEEDEVEAVVIVEGEVGGIPRVQAEEVDATIQASVAGPKMGKK